MINDTELEMVLRTSVKSSDRPVTRSGHLSGVTAESQDSVRIACVRAKIRSGSIHS